MISKTINSYNSEYYDKKLSDLLPLITIGITCFNAEKTIDKALKSAFEQDWPNLEIILINDGSTDGSKYIIDSWLLMKKNIIAINNTCNMGCAKARNIIISKSQGEFIAFFDDDDISRKDRVRLQYEATLKYEKKHSTQLIACFASGKRIYNNGYIKNFCAAGVKGKAPIGLQMANYLLFFDQKKGVSYGSGVPTCSLFARTSIFSKLGGFDVELRRQEDIDFGIRLAMQGAHFIGIEESVITQYATSGIDKSALIEFQSADYLINKYAKYLNSKGLYKYMKLWIKIRYAHFNSNELIAFLILIKLFIRYPVRTLFHFFKSAYKRLIHEKLMNSSAKNIILLTKCVKFLNRIF